MKIKRGRTETVALLAAMAFSRCSDKTPQPPLPSPAIEEKETLPDTSVMTIKRPGKEIKKAEIKKTKSPEPTPTLSERYASEFRSFALYISLQY